MTEKEGLKVTNISENGNTGLFWLGKDNLSVYDVVRLINDLLEENEQLLEENEQLKKEKEFWKGDACNCSNYLSILSMDCQIVQEAICDLKNVIDVDTEAFRLLDELDDKFDELNQHRIKMYSR